MSDSRAKYEEIVGDLPYKTPSKNQRETLLTLEILKAVERSNTLEVFVDKIERISKENPTFSTLVILQIAADEALVDEHYS